MCSPRTGRCRAGRSSMWTAALALLQLWALAEPLRAQTDVETPQDCSLECIRQLDTNGSNSKTDRAFENILDPLTHYFRNSAAIRCTVCTDSRLVIITSDLFKGGAACRYCRIRKDDIKKALGLNSIRPFGSCIPWPCLELLGGEDPRICQHYVQAPNDVKIEFVDEPNPKYDTIVVSWKPSYYGIAFLRGFQVSLQALGGSSTNCQLFLFHRNVSLSTSQAQRVYMSDPFPGLSLGSQYAVTVMALPVPEKWEKFYRSKIFSTRSCAEKNGLDQCKQDWYPEHIEVQQEGAALNVTFNLAPAHLGIRSYFSLCYGNGKKRYTDITPSENKTHHTYQLHDLQEGTNYTCEIAANEVDAVRKVFIVQVKGIKREKSSAMPSLTMALPLCLAVLVMLGALLAVLICWRPWQRGKISEVKPDIIRQHEESGTQEEVVSLTGCRPRPPRLLICYSGSDGPWHVKIVVQFAAFVQQHMATQVHLDLWDSLSVAEEGSMAWHCRQIQENDFVLVICSPGLRRRPEAPDPEGSDEDEEELDLTSDTSSSVVIRLIGEEVCRAKAQDQDLSKYMVAVFEYSDETDIPVELRLVSRYALTRDLPLLFSHLHGVPLHQPGRYLKIEHISDEGFAASPAGSALQQAIRDAVTVAKAKRRQVAEEVD